MNCKKNTINPKILFYTAAPRLFRTTLISHLYEIAKTYPVVLLSENLDYQTKKIVRNKNFFPNIIKIVEVLQHSREKTGLFKKNRYLYNLAKNVIDVYKPDIVITDNDIYSFELYLLRFAKMKKSLNICFQAGFQAADLKKISFALNIQTAYLRVPWFIPFRFLKVIFSKIRRIIGYMIYYWFLPLSVFELPFFGSSSYILLKGSVGSRDCDYRIVFSKRDYNLHIEDGISPKKLYILTHPWTRKTKYFLRDIFLKKYKKKSFSRKKKIITIMWTPETISVNRKNNSLIFEIELKRIRMDGLFLIADVLKDWLIFIKPHPDTLKISELSENLRKISKNIKITDPKNPVDEFVEISDVIVGFPPLDTAIFTAALQCPEKPVLMLDLDNELFGDVFLDGVSYIKSKKQLEKTLGLIKSNQYPKAIKPEFEQEGFKSAKEIIEFLYNKNNYGKRYF